MSTSYTADDLQHLEGLDAVRKRPGMYIGDTDSRGLSHLLFEIVDNSVDEALAGYCTRIDVTVDPETNTVSVADDGRGIPTGINAKTKLSGVTLAFTKLHAGGKFGGSGYKSAGGLHGVGAAVTNALSEMCTVEVRQGAKVHRVEFSRGVVGTFDKAGKFTAKKGADLKVVGKCPKAETGTLVTFRPDPAVFAPGARIDLDLVRERLRRTAFLVPGLTIALDAGDGVEEFRFDGGIKDLAEASATGTPLCPVIDIHGTGSFTETVPVLQEDGSLKSDDVDREVEVRVAIAPTAGYDTDIASFVNIVNTSLGGTHVKGFEAGLLKWARANATLKAKDPALVLADCLEGLAVVVSVGVPEPQFTSQAKVQLGTAPVQGVVAAIVDKGLTDWMNARGNKQPAKTLLDKIVTAAKVRVATKEERDTKRRKTALEGGGMPAKLVDCRSRDDSELFIVEGDSALGTARQGRIASHQALLPVRGKILNVRKATLKAALDNAEVSAIIQCLGTGVGKDYDAENRRYDRVILMSDADADGYSINLLCVVLFWTLMPEWVKDGRLFVAMPPLFTVNVKGRHAEKLFAVDADELAKVTNPLDKKGTPYTVGRNKGLGEMDAGELKETTMSPASRRLKRISVADAQAVSASLDLFMGNDVAPRRDWIFDNLDMGIVDA